MKSSLSDTIWLSEKRKNLLLLLVEGPRNIDQIKTSLNVTSKAMMPQIKILKEQDMIIQNESDEYELSDVGRIIVKNMSPLLKTLEVIEENREYWATRDLTAIPESLAYRLGELGQCMFIEPDLNHMFDLPIEFTENLTRSKDVKMFASYFHPLYPELFSEIIEKGIKFELILTDSVLERMKKDCLEHLKLLASSENTELHICDDSIKLTTISVTERFTYICLFNKDGRYDHTKLMSFDDSARLWGDELFSYYQERSRQLKDI
ncbi:helix-turn-helix transcriptional regulator [Methanococcoides methylutens]|uniref:helix-turn-helix transcriptional regulator n=1 Tax=Methanococcoides methylutens TaxID=2226 RepID=UPI004044880D